MEFYTLCVKITCAAGSYFSNLDEYQNRVQWIPIQFECYDTKINIACLYSRKYYKIWNKFLILKF